MTAYKVQQNNLNDFKYIVFRRGSKRYKVQKLNDTDVYIWIDNSCFSDYQNIQLLKVIKSDCDKNDFDTLYNIAETYLRGKY